MCSDQTELVIEQVTKKKFIHQEIILDQFVTTLTFCHLKYEIKKEIEMSITLFFNKFI